MKEEVAALHPVFRLEDEQHYRDVPTETWFPTNYESRFLAEGFTCHAATFRKAT
jgi:tRNA G46 methylase TrmB